MFDAVCLIQVKNDAKTSCYQQATIRGPKRRISRPLHFRNTKRNLMEHVQ